MRNIKTYAALVALGLGVSSMSVACNRTGQGAAIGGGLGLVMIVLKVALH